VRAVGALVEYPVALIAVGGKQSPIKAVRVDLPDPVSDQRLASTDSIAGVEAVTPCKQSGEKRFSCTQSRDSKTAMSSVISSEPGHWIFLYWWTASLPRAASGGRVASVGGLGDEA